MRSEPAQLHLKLRDLGLKVLDGVVVLLLVLGSVAVESREELLDSLLELLVVPSEALIEALLELHLGFFARLVLPDALVFLLLLAGQLSHQNVSGPVPLLNYALELRHLRP